MNLKPQWAPARILSGLNVASGATKATIATTPVPGAPGSIAVDPFTQRIYVTNGGADSAGRGVVEVIDGRTNSLTSTKIEVGYDPGAEAIDIYRGLLFVANEDQYCQYSIASEPCPATGPSVSVIRLRRKP